MIYGDSKNSDSADKEKICVQTASPDIKQIRENEINTQRKTRQEYYVEFNTAWYLDIRAGKQGGNNQNINKI